MQAESIALMLAAGCVATVCAAIDVWLWRAARRAWSRGRAPWRERPWARAGGTIAGAAAAAAATALMIASILTGLLVYLLSGHTRPFG